VDDCDAVWSLDTDHVGINFAVAANLSAFSDDAACSDARFVADLRLRAYDDALGNADPRTQHSRRMNHRTWVDASLPRIRRRALAQQLRGSRKGQFRIVADQERPAVRCLGREFARDDGSGAGDSNAAARCFSSSTKTIVRAR
jgi:hypothetical protein